MRTERRHNTARNSKLSKPPREVPAYGRIVIYSGRNDIDLLEKMQYCNKYKIMLEMKKEEI